MNLFGLLRTDSSDFLNWIFHVNMSRDYDCVSALVNPTIGIILSIQYMWKKFDR